MGSQRWTCIHRATSHQILDLGQSLTFSETFPQSFNMWMRATEQISKRSHHSIVYIWKKRKENIVVLQRSFTKFNVVISTMQLFNNDVKKDFLCKESSKVTLFTALEIHHYHQQKEQKYKEAKAASSVKQGKGPTTSCEAYSSNTAEFGTKRGGRLRTSSYLQQNAGFLKIKYPSPGKASMNLWWEWQDVRMRTSHGRTGCVQQRPISTAGGKGGEEAKREAALAFHLIYGHASILWRLQSKALDEWGIHPQPTTQRNLGTEWTEMLDLARGYLSHKSHKTWPAVQNRWVHNPSFSRPQSSAHYSLANIWFNKKQTNKNQR